MTDILFDVIDDDGVTVETVATDPDVTLLTLAGPTGPTGAPGEDGATITADSGAPSGSANPGDLYINTTTGDLYRWNT